MRATKMIRVLIVDDSAFVRKVLRQMLARSPFIEVVGSARDGAEALELTAELNPDVITLDLMMPEVDGVEFLRRQMVIRPVPVVICSITPETGTAVLEAFEAGAVEFVQKPTALATDRVYEIADELVAKVKEASQAVLAHRAPPVPDTHSARRISQPRQADGVDIVVIGVSTGGPQALRYLIPLFPADFPVPVAMVLHMPVGYTEMYAKRLDEISAIDVKEAAEGDVMRGGMVYLAPAGRHLSFVRQADGSVTARLDVRPIDTQHRPAVDVLFKSASEIYGPKVLGVVMTGMGNDGVIGSSFVKMQGGRVITEAESSCVVYGMPRAVVEAGASDVQVPLDGIMATIQRMV